VAEAQTDRVEDQAISEKQRHVVEHHEAHGGGWIAYAAPVEGDLAGAIDAVHGKRWPEALATTLAVWRGVRAPELGDAYDAIAARALDVITPPFATDPNTRNSRWLELRKQLGDPMVRIALCAGLRQLTRTADLIARLDQLLLAGPDPFVASTFCELLERPWIRVGHPDTARFWSHVWSLLPRLGDPRVLARAPRFSDQDAMVHAMPALEAAYAHRPPPPPLTAELLAAARDRSIGPGRARREAELLAAIYAELSADAPRLVYADWLQEHGDPRGEFIALQLRPSRGDVELRREAELLEAHFARWIYPLEIERRHAVFERGFLARVGAVNFTDDPVWSTVIAARFPSDRLAQLRGVVRPLALTSLTIDNRHDAPPLPDLATLAILPRLTELTVNPVGYAMTPGTTHADVLALLRTPIGEQLEELALWISPLALGDLLPRLPPRLRKFQLVMPFITDYGLTFSRDARGVLGELSLDLRLIYPDHRDLDQLMRGLQLLPADQLSAITIAEPRRPESSVVLHRVRQVLAAQTSATITLTF
jgi:uncharacterized protein (TIGR02996 family)